MKLKNLTKQVKSITRKGLNKLKAFIDSQLGAQSDDFEVLSKVEKKK